MLCVAEFQQLNQSKSLGRVIKHKHLIIVNQGEGMHIRKLRNKETKSGCRYECCYFKIPVTLVELLTSLKLCFLISFVHLCAQSLESS